MTMLQMRDVDKEYIKLEKKNPKPKNKSVRSNGK